MQPAQQTNADARPPAVPFDSTTPRITARVIRSSPHDTSAYTQGLAFSGGQLQRMMVARALARKPRVLFFDEATSALDDKSQEAVSLHIQDLDSTRIVIAHRLSTIRQADKIYVLDAGRIVESGTYEELMAADGLFKNLTSRQLV